MTAPNNTEFIKIMSQVMTALEDRELDSHEAAVLCEAAAKIILKCRSLFTKWWQRALLDSASSALRECSNHLEKLNE